MLTAYTQINGGNTYRINWWDGDKNTIMALAKEYIRDLARANMMPGDAFVSADDGMHLRFTNRDGDRVRAWIEEAS